MEMATQLQTGKKRLASLLTPVDRYKAAEHSALYSAATMIITILEKKEGSAPAEDPLRPHLSVAYDVPIV